MTVAPVKIAMSSNIAFLLSPNPGAFTAAIFKDPRILLITRVANASPSTSSAMISSDLPCCATGSKTGMRSFIEEIFLSHNKIIGFSSSVCIFSLFVTKYGDK
ncbi:MAG: Uncharacterised protein [Flavobacteriaceae bacterium]|nr:MAG: Uncharacterised protein [Flavobacteriaceae bacterium]